MTTNNRCIEFVVVADRASANEICGLFARSMANFVPILSGEHHGLVAFVAWRNDHEVTAIYAHVALQMMGFVPAKVFGRGAE